MNTLWTVIAVLLALASLLSMVRLLLGPSILDRALSVDVLLASALVGLGAYAAFHRDPTVLPTLMVLSLVGFVATISIAKFVARRPEEHVSTPTDVVHPVPGAPSADEEGGRP
ncbi:monovalent cation/H+ antiporter complex subunit F [Nocardiopsis changdeensis]|uniref:Cation:proton antiporter n=1 Tax=Nocardiopsis changdeensis TaxID=2831969 RepID=A0ABX8BNK8_9ACTN|nr:MULTISPECIES: monovalent cation/H+ antiporter complex subunit F [Nocardiopsis]QUX22333.1 cation:proton antiporter [Nocardiopsis changdeensis]QYX38274.1 cation:proton antiporter [Nocardiopsis sp. MT53]